MVNFTDKTKSQLEHHRVQRAMSGDNSDGAAEPDDTERDMKLSLEEAKARFVYHILFGIEKYMDGSVSLFL